MSVDRLAFTGTRKGMTQKQFENVQELLSYMKPTEVRHGDCVGADEQFHQLAAFRSFIVIHPSTIESLRARCKGGSVTILPPRSPLVRNHEMVDACEVLLAAPETGHEVLRSGTWATVRYAVKKGKRVFLLGPDGIMEKLGPPPDADGARR